ncbi:MAG: phosphoribosyltransferase [Bacteroidota bacterium]
MNFRSIAQLSDQLINWSKELPHDLDLIVGIPRSGMLAANILALYRNLPLAELNGFLEGRIMGTGKTRVNPLAEKREDIAPGEDAVDSSAVAVAAEHFLDGPRNVLVLDDSIWSGSSLREARRCVEAASLPHRVQYGAVYVTPDTTDLPDHYCEVLHYPRCFEWNVLHHHVLHWTCLDMDGVLCADPLDHENDDGERYRAFLHTARPLHLPTDRVKAIVTNRLEKYRPETEDWLRRHGITFEHLIMMDYPDGATRRRMNTYSAHKAKAYRETEARLFIESDIKQAVEIANLSQKQVLCIDTMQMIQPGNLPVARPGWPLPDAFEPTLARRVVRRLLSKEARDRIAAARRRLNGND